MLISTNACVEYAAALYDPIEYCVLGGVNDSEACAEELADLMTGRETDVIVNLIPYNPTDVPMGRGDSRSHNIHVCPFTHPLYARLDDKGSHQLTFFFSFCFFFF